MHTVSFDIGTTNLAYVIVDESLTIKEWAVVDISKNSTLQTINTLKLIFDNDTINPGTIKAVVLEKQPSRNPKMRVVENTIDVFFTMLGVTKVIHYSAKHKLGSIGKTIKGQKNYTMRKRYGMFMCVSFLKKTTETNQDFLTYYESHKKKDDLADCLLQCISYLNKQMIDELSTCIAIL